MERTLHVSITNSLGNLALAGPHGGLWKPVDGFQLKLLPIWIPGEAVDASIATNQLNCAIIHKVTLVEQQSTFPVPLGVEVNCVPPREVTELGQKYAYTVLPKSNSSTPQTIYEAECLNDEMYEWHKQFPQYPSANLDNYGVIPVNNQPFVFVDCQHPVISLLRHNSHLIGCDIDSQKLIDGQYFKISKQVLQSCCDTLRRKVLSRVTSHNLNTLSVQIHRIDAGKLGGSAGRNSRHALFQNQLKCHPGGGGGGGQAYLHKHTIHLHGQEQNQVRTSMHSIIFQFFFIITKKFYAKKHAIKAYCNVKVN